MTLILFKERTEAFANGPDYILSNLVFNIY